MLEKKRSVGRPVLSLARRLSGIDDSGKRIPLQVVK
jgi:hypothetical protein